MQIMTQCKAKTKKGTRCEAHAGSDGFCFFHSPLRAADRAKAHKRGGRAKIAPKPTAGVPCPQIESIADVLALVNFVVRDIWELENTCPRARTLLSAAAEARADVSAGELEQRVARLEQALAQRT